MRQKLLADYLEQGSILQEHPLLNVLSLRERSFSSVQFCSDTLLDAV